MPRACAVCGSRKWRKDAVTGSAVCEEGHVYQDYVAEVQDVDLGTQNFTLHRRRTGRRPGRRKKGDSQANPDFYHGIEAEWLRLQALQLLLRGQVVALKHLWKLPDSFEEVVRDLWAYQLAITALPKPPFEEDKESSGPNTVTHGRSLHPQQQSLTQEKQDVFGGSSESESSNEQDDKNTDKEDDVDSVLLEELEKGDNDESDSEQGALRLHQGPGWKRKRMVRASDVVVTLVLGIIALRVPFTHEAIQNLINDNEIPYIDFAHTNLVPAEMKRHMNRDITLALCPSSAPQPLLLYRQTCSFARILSQRFHVDLPETNFTPVAWHIVSSLGGAPTTHEQVIALLGLLDLGLTLVPSDLTEVTARFRRAGLRRDDGTGIAPAETSAAPTGERTISYLRARKHELIMPELAVAAVLLLLWKLIYGFDGFDRCVSENDSALAMPTQAAWMDALRERMVSQRLRRSSVINRSKQDWASASTLDVDRFLYQAEKVLLRNRDFDTSAEMAPFDLPAVSTPQLHNTFPNIWADFHRSTPVLQSTLVSSAGDGADDSKSLRPGQQLRVYDAADYGGAIPPDMQTAVSAAAEVTGVSQTDVLEVLEIFERRLEVLRAGKSARMRSRSRPQSGLGSAATSRKSSLHDLASYGR